VPVWYYTVCVGHGNFDYGDCLKIHQLPGPVNTYGRNPHRRKFVRVARCPFFDTTVYVFSNCAENVVAAVCQRIALPVCEPKPSMLVLVRKFYQYLATRFDVHPIGFREVINCYRSAKKKKYEKALRMIYSGVYDDQIRATQVFVKNQKELVEPFGKVRKPRGIYATSPVLCLLMARFIKPLEEQLIQLIGIDPIEGILIGEPTRQVGGRLFTKGLTLREQAIALREDWESYGVPVVIPMDGDKFEGHQSNAMMDETWLFYNRVSHWIYRTLQKYCRYAHLYSDTGLVATLEGKLLSGKRDTSVQGCLHTLTYLFIMYVVYMKMDVRFKINGDDSNVTTDIKELKTGWQECIVELGGRLGQVFSVSEPVRHFEQLDYCQTRPIYVNGWVMCGIPSKVLCTSTVVDKAMKVKSMRDYIYSYGLAELISYNGAPIITAHAKALMSLSKGRLNTNYFDDWLYEELKLELKGKTFRNIQPMVISAKARETFARAFDISVERQLFIEHYFLNKWQFEIKEPEYGGLFDHATNTLFTPRA